MSSDPASPWVRRLLLLVVAGLVVVLLFTVVFPAVTARLQDPTLGAPATTTA